MNVPLRTLALLNVRIMSPHFKTLTRNYDSVAFFTFKKIQYLLISVSLHDNNVTYTILKVK